MSPTMLVIVLESVKCEKMKYKNNSSRFYLDEKDKERLIIRSFFLRCPACNWSLVLSEYACCL